MPPTLCDKSRLSAQCTPSQLLSRKLIAMLITHSTSKIF